MWLLAGHPCVDLLCILAQVRVLSLFWSNYRWLRNVSAKGGPSLHPRNVSPRLVTAYLKPRYYNLHTMIS
jgi:hypothetical protein